MSDNTPRGQVNEGELRSGPIAGTAVVSAATFTGVPLRYADVDGLAIVEGDIIRGRVADLQAAEAAGNGFGPQVRSIGITGQTFRWPGGTVRFDVAAGMPDRQRVTDAIAHWEATIAETIVQPGPPSWLRQPQGATPFIMAGASQFGGGQGYSVGATTHVPSLPEAIIAVEQQLAELMAAYEEALLGTGKAGPK